VKRAYPSTLIVLVLALGIANAERASPKHPAPDQHQERSDKHSEGAERGPLVSSVPMVPLSVQETSQSALLEALRALHAEQEARAKDRRLSYEPWYAPAVLAQIVLCFIGAGYTYYAARQWGSIREQTLIANKTLLLQFRPKLIVRNFVVRPPIADEVPQPTFPIVFFKNYPVSGQFYVANIGGIPAIVTESHCIVHWRKGLLPMRRPYEGDNGNNPVQGRIEAGGRATALFLSDKPLELSHTELGHPSFPDFDPVWTLYIMGWIEYADGLGFERRMAFCRKYDHRTDRFIAIDDPDYEHTDS